MNQAIDIPIYGGYDRQCKDVEGGEDEAFKGVEYYLIDGSKETEDALIDNFYQLVTSMANMGGVVAPCLVQTKTINTTPEIISIDGGLAGFSSKPTLYSIKCLNVPSQICTYVQNNIFSCTFIGIKGFYAAYFDFVGNLGIVPPEEVEAGKADVFEILNHFSCTEEEYENVRKQLIDEINSIKGNS